MSSQLVSLLQQRTRPRILVLGDCMLDRYLWGDVERISPEAPIPVLTIRRQEHRLGGAGNVAAMLAALEVDPVLATVAGEDADAATMRQLLDTASIANCVVVDRARPTTVKERLLGRNHQRFPQQMMRVDRESAAPLSVDLCQQLLTAIEPHLDATDLVVISDYNKGVCAGDLIPRLVAMCRARRIDVLADPLRGADYHRYAGCRCITPNRVEAGLATGMTIATPADGLEAATRLLAFGVEAAAVTLDRDGIAWADRQGNRQHFPVRQRQVCDITGAGDTVLAALGYCFAAGADYVEAVEIANLAGGLEVERLGVVPITRREILAELAETSHSTRHKIVELEQLQNEISRRRLAGQRIAMTNGCFDLLHPGHVASLQAARRQGDCLVVGLNSDQSVRQLKGPDRPLIDQQGRADMLAALACVDYVVLFDETSVAPLVEAIGPDVLVKAAQYAPEEVVGHDLVVAHGGTVVTVPMRPSYSTTQIVDRIVAARRHPQVS